MMNAIADLLTERARIDVFEHRATRVRVSRRLWFSLDVDATAAFFEYVDSNILYARTVRAVHVCSFCEDLNVSLNTYRYTQIAICDTNKAYKPLQTHRFGCLAVPMMWEDGISPGGQYSSLGDGAAGVFLGVVHMEGAQVRVQVECGREEVSNREKQEKDKHEETDNERTIKRSSWMRWRWSDARIQTLEPCSVICMKRIVQTARENDVWGVSVHTPRRLQWIAIDCKRNQL